MAFEQQTLNSTTEYIKAMANAYPHWSYFSDLYGSPNSATYKPIGGKSVAVQSMTVGGARAVNRDSIDGNFKRNFNTDQQILTMSMDREWDTLVDPMDIQEDAIVTLANITQTCPQFQKIPEQDAYAASKLAAAASGFGGVDATTLTADNIPPIFLRHYPAFKNKNLNLSELARVCDISRTTAYKYIDLLEGRTA